MAIGAHAARGPGPGDARASRAAARRCTSAWPRTASSSRASRTAWSRRRARYLRLDGETPGNPDNPGASRGQIVVLDAARGRDDRRDPAHVLRRDRAAGAPKTSSSRRRSRPATSTAATSRTTCSRRSPRRRRRSARRCAGKIIERDGRPVVELPHETLSEDAPVAAAGRAVPPGARHRPGHRRGRGSEPRRRAAARARTGDAARGRGRARDRALRLPARGRHERHARDRDQPERDHHRHQPHGRSRARPAARRCSRSSTGATATSSTAADGVLYTSDGRDVEMSVASTKAFYAQVAAGFLLAFALADELTGGPSRGPRHDAARAAGPAGRDGAGARRGARRSA